MLADVVPTCRLLPDHDVGTVVGTVHLQDHLTGADHHSPEFGGCTICGAQELKLHGFVLLRAL
jgi:hypothetical protein